MDRGRTRILRCRRCDDSFDFTVGEQAFFKSRNLVPPSHCRTCLQALRRQRQHSPSSSRRHYDNDTRPLSPSPRVRRRSPSPRVRRRSPSPVRSTRYQNYAERYTRTFRSFLQLFALFFADGLLYHYLFCRSVPHTPRDHVPSLWQKRDGALQAETWQGALL